MPAVPHFTPKPLRVPSGEFRFALERKGGKAVSRCRPQDAGSRGMPSSTLVLSLRGRRGRQDFGLTQSVMIHIITIL
jgi:hypothetical protein